MAAISGYYHSVYKACAYGSNNTENHLGILYVCGCISAYKKVNILGVYLYEMAFARNDLGKAAAISILLFVIIFSFIIFIRKKVDINEQK